MGCKDANLAELLLVILLASTSTSKVIKFGGVEKGVIPSRIRGSNTYEWNYQARLWPYDKALKLNITVKQMNSKDDLEIKGIGKVRISSCFLVVQKLSPVQKIFSKYCDKIPDHDETCKVLQTKKKIQILLQTEPDNYVNDIFKAEHKLLQCSDGSASTPVSTTPTTTKSTTTENLSIFNDENTVKLQEIQQHPVLLDSIVTQQRKSQIRTKTTESSTLLTESVTVDDLKPLSTFTNSTQSHNSTIVDLYVIQNSLPTQPCDGCGPNTAVIFLSVLLGIISIASVTVIVVCVCKRKSSGSMPCCLNKTQHRSKLPQSLVLSSPPTIPNRDAMNSPQRNAISNQYSIINFRQPPALENGIQASSSTGVNDKRTTRTFRPYSHADTSTTDNQDTPAPRQRFISQPYVRPTHQNFETFHNGVYENEATVAENDRGYETMRVLPLSLQLDSSQDINKGPLPGYEEMKDNSRDVVVETEYYTIGETRKQEDQVQSERSSWSEDVESDF